MQYVHRQLGPGMPEYIYQEALCRKLVKEKFDVRKEFIYHPFFDGEQLESYIKMYMVVIMPRGNAQSTDRALLLPRRYHKGFLK